MTLQAIRLLAVLACVAGHGWVAAQEPKPSPATPIPKPAATPAAVPSLLGKLTFKPVLRGAPAGRVDAASRGDGDEVASLYVLAPAQVGLTTKAQPTLYWYQTRPAEVPCEFALLRENQAEPVLRVAFKDARRAGWQQLSLAAHAVTLEPGVEYQWVVALVRDPGNRSRDIVSSAWVQRVPALAGGRPTPQDYAAHGIWYDALEALSEKIAAHPGDQRLQAVRDDFLSQVGLPHLMDSAGSKAPAP